ncbi:MAG: YfhL family 4Fe-4S dicluster ferredoxin [Myxococcota bacterium]
MALLINEECINCGACEPDCPNEAITEGDDIYLIDPAKCTECIGHHDEPQCIDVCPVDDCIPKDPNHVESKEQLQAKFESLQV